MCRLCQGWDLDDNKKPIRLYKCFKCGQHADKAEDIVHTTCTPGTQHIEKNPYLNDDGSENFFMNHRIEISVVLVIVVWGLLFAAIIKFLFYSLPS